MKSLLLCALLLWPSVAGATPIQWVSTAVNYETHSVDVQIQFSGAPDLFTVDQYGRQADSWQLYSYEHPPLDPLPYSNITSITRGEEIHWNEGLVMRTGVVDFSATEPTPELLRSGGWGDPLGLVPFTLQGESLTYTASLRAMGDTDGDGRFQFDVLATSFGATNGAPPGLVIGYYLPGWFTGCVSDSLCRNTPRAAVPEPSSAWLTVMGFIGLVIVGWFTHTRRNSKCLN